MKITSGTVFRLYDGNTYVYQVGTGMSYLFSEIVYDVLRCVREKGEVSLEGLCLALGGLYDVDDPQAFRSDIRALTVSLAEQNILNGLEEPGSGNPDGGAPSPEDLINHVCIDRHILQRVCLELTYRCNERCRHCYVGDENKSHAGELTLDEYRTVLDDLRRMGTLHLTLTGGDVAMREDFLDILRCATEKGFAVSIYTNGIGFGEETLDEIARLHPRAVSFSLYSGIPEEHDAVTGVKGSFQRTLYALMRLKCAGVLVDVKTSAMRPTRAGFPALVKLCRQLDVELETAFLLCATNHGCLSPTQLRLGDVVAYKDMMRLCVWDKPEGPEIARDIHGPVCGAGALSLSIDPFGGVFPCNGFHVLLGNIRKVSIADIWESDKLREIYEYRFDQLGERCTRCIWRDDCLYCAGASLAENGDVYKPIPETCLIAQAAYEVRREVSESRGEIS